MAVLGGWRGGAGVLGFSIQVQLLYLVATITLLLPAYTSLSVTECTSRVPEDCHYNEGPQCFLPYTLVQISTNY